MAIQQTYSMIKPDGVRNGHIGEIINRFERAGLTIERMELGMVTPEQAKANYAEHEGKPFYDGLGFLHPSGGCEDGRLRQGCRGDRSLMAPLIRQRRLDSWRFRSRYGRKCHTWFGFPGIRRT